MIVVISLHSRLQNMKTPSTYQGIFPVYLHLTGTINFCLSRWDNNSLRHLQNHFLGSISCLDWHTSQGAFIACDRFNSETQSGPMFYMCSAGWLKAMTNHCFYLDRLHSATMFQRAEWNNVSSFCNCLRDIRPEVSNDISSHFHYDHSACPI